MGKVIAAIIAVIIIGGGGYLALSNNSDDSSKKHNNNTNQSQDSSDNTTQGSAGGNEQVVATIIYSDTGFSPKNITVKVGDKVSIKNSSSRDMQFDSDPHPAHTDNEELNVGTVGPNESMTFTVSRTGTFGYHDHINPSATGTIVVQ